MLEISCVSKTTIIWGRVTELRSETEFFVISGHSFPSSPLTTQKIICRFHHFTHVYQKSSHIIYAFWDMECDRHNFLPFCTIFLPFYPPNNLKNQNFEKWKKYGDIITLHLRTTNDDHMMYGSWDMEHDRHNFLSLFGYVLLFYAPNNLENQNFEKMKKYTKNHDHMPYCSWDMVHDECNCYFSFWAIFPFYPRNSPRNQNLKKREKNVWRYHFTQVYQKLWSDIRFLRYGAQRTNGRTNGKSDI